MILSKELQEKWGLVHVLFVFTRPLDEILLWPGEGRRAITLAYIYIFLKFGFEIFFLKIVDMLKCISVLMLS